MNFLQHAKAALFVFGVLASSLSFSKDANAHGYPPFGAWAYGSGYTVGYGRSRTVYRSAVRPGWHGWGGYGNYGFSATTRVRMGYPTYRTVYRTNYRVAPVVHFSPIYYSRYYRTSVIPSAYFSTRYVTPYSYVSPFFYTVPTFYRVPSYRVSYPVYSAPIFVSPIFYSPTFCSATGTSTAPSVNGLATGNRSQSSAQFATLNGMFNSSGVPVSIARPTNSASTHLVSKVSGADVDDNTRQTAIPTVLLDAADAILKAGGQQEAATAYAELSVRYGTQVGLLERRFVANVLSGNLAQAEVIIGLAQITNTELLGHSLGMGGLRAFIDSPILYQSACESLAKRALENPSDPTAMRCVATWLRMGADHARADLFFSSAEKIENGRPVADDVPSVRTVAKPEMVISPN